MEKGYTHYAHCNDIYVQEGDIVEPGFLLGKLGKTGNAPTAHCHFEAWRIDPRSLGDGWYDRYTTGMTMAQVDERYMKPGDYLQDKVYPVDGGYIGTGYVYGQINADNQIHPGDDINAGPGDADIGTPLRVVEWSEVIYANKTGSTGFGRHVYLRALKDSEIPNKPTKRYMNITENAQMIWTKINDVTEFWVIFKRQDGTEVKRPVKQHITLCAEVFANNDHYCRWSTQEQLNMLAGYPEGQEYDIVEQFKNHPELFEKQ